MKAIIVDDERHALNRLELFLTDHVDVRIVARCSSGADAIKAIEKHEPDVVFLDIEMPEVDGFDVARPFIDADGPNFIFVTAFDEYAIKAFDSKAVDYLLKPVSRPRLSVALQRVRKRLSMRRSLEQVDQLENVIEELRKGQADASVHSQYRDFWIKDAGRILRVSQSEIRWVQADRDYVHLHTANRKFIMRETMANMIKRLNPHHFVRIHRSTIVNAREMESFETGRAGILSVLLKDGTRLAVGRTYRSDLSGRMHSA